MRTKKWSPPCQPLRRSPVSGHDVIVIGAGAAGIAAARRLTEAGLDVVILEARNRVGGRAYTDETFAAHPVELGAEFIHGQNVATWEWVRAHGVATTGEAHRYQQWFHWGGQLLDSEAFYLLAGDLHRMQQRLRHSRAREGGEDVSAAVLFDGWEGATGTPLSAEGRRLVDNMVAQGTAAEGEELGVLASGEATYEGDGDRRHFRLLAGYSDLMRRAAAGLEVRLSTAVSRVEWSEGAVQVATPGGTLEAATAVITLPLGVLQSGDVTFLPELPRGKQDAIARINPGAIGKVVLKFDSCVWPPDLTFLWTPRDSQLWWRPGQGQEAEEPVLTAFFGGDDARAMAARTVADAAMYAMEDLEAITGKKLASRLVDYRVLAWNNEPYTQMGYSSLPPGGRGLRAALAATSHPLYFAGEATSTTRPATVHGAIESGIRAAGEILGRAT